MQLPAGYRELDVGGAALVARADAFERARHAMIEHGTLYEWAANQPGVRALHGRGETRVVPLETGAWVVRHAFRGGAVARLLGDRYLRSGEPRPYAELRVSHGLRQHNIETPAVVAFAVYPDGMFYRADIVTEYIPDSVDLATLTFGEHRAPPGHRVAAWRAAGALLRRTFNAGLLHPDLNLGNILIAGDPESPRAWMIDLDRARLGGDMTAGRRVAMQRRMNRSREKLEAKFGQAVGRMELIAFGEALHG
ncbi:MAG TPA: lipopolysaccharide kinase InaA family protein [Longimicrobiales bacterium]|nr:lipopolysaccharide kinase InaA family protein [Longimicrobiales bacterium]